MIYLYRTTLFFTKKEKKRTLTWNRHSCLLFNSVSSNIYSSNSWKKIAAMEFKFGILFLFIYWTQIECFRVGLIQNVSLTGEKGIVKNGISCNECACLLTMNTTFVSFNCYLLNASCEFFNSYNLTIDYQVKNTLNSIFYFIQLPPIFQMSTIINTGKCMLLLPKNSWISIVWLARKIIKKWKQGTSRFFSIPSLPYSAENGSKHLQKSHIFHSVYFFLKNMNIFVTVIDSTSVIPNCWILVIFSRTSRSLYGFCIFLYYYWKSLLISYRILFLYFSLFTSKCTDWFLSYCFLHCSRLLVLKLPTCKGARPTFERFWSNSY